MSYQVPLVSIVMLLALNISIEFTDYGFSNNLCRELTFTGTQSIHKNITVPKNSVVKSAVINVSSTFYNYFLNIFNWFFVSNSYFCLLDSIIFSHMSSIPRYSVVSSAVMNVSGLIGGGSLCYQETANLPPACGGLIVEIMVQKVLGQVRKCLWWKLDLLHSIFGSPTYVYINYTKFGHYGIWQVKDNSATVIVNSFKLLNYNSA